MLYKVANTNLVLGIDIDNVINNLQQPVIKLIKQELHKDVDINHYNFFKDLHMNDSQRHDFFLKYAEWLFHNVKPQWRVAFYLQKLSEEYKIILITARQYNLAEMTVKWLKKYNIYYDELYFNAGDKVDACEFYNTEYMVEDSPWNLKKLNKANLKTLIFNQPYNQDVSENELAKRVYSWEDIYNFLILQE